MNLRVWLRFTEILVAAGNCKYSCNAQADMPAPMRRWTARPRPLLATAAVFLAVIATLYGLLWMYDVRSPNSQVELGFNYQHSEQYDEKTHSILVNDVAKDSPAERAGLRAGDRIIAVNGQMLTTSAPYDQAYTRGRPGDPVEFTLARPGEPLPVVIHGIFRVRPSVEAQEGLAKSTAQQILSSFPPPFPMTFPDRPVEL